MKSHNRLCPICSSEKRTVLIPIKFSLFDGHPMNGGYDLVKCDNCGFVYADTSVTQAQLDGYYTELSKYEDKVISTGGGYDQNDRDRLKVTAEFLSGYISNRNARILDLGCANGGLLKELKDLGFENLVGIDPSAACVDITRQEVDCEAYQYSLFDIPENIGKFDLIIVSHVLEHLLDIAQAMNVIDSLLSDGGSLYAECPNAAFYDLVIHAPLQEFNTEHINHFSVTSFRNLMSLHGYSELTTGDKTMIISSGQDYHAVYGVFSKVNLPRGLELKFDSSIDAPMHSYISQSKEMLSEIVNEIKTIPEDTPIALFGVGQFSFKLLATEELKNRKQIRLFDNNKVNVGKTISGTLILHGSELVSEYEKEKFTIVISSLIHETPIRTSIEKMFGDTSDKPKVIGFSHVLKSQ